MKPQFSITNSLLRLFFSALLLGMMAFGPQVQAQTITEIIDATGDGAGNILDGAGAIAVDGSGNIYVSGSTSDNAFKITPGSVITEIIDATGDGAGNLFDGAGGVAVDGSGNVYITGFTSDNAFKITPGGVITEIIDATGDGAGNSLNLPSRLTVDGSGNVYVLGQSSSNAFKIAAPGTCSTGGTPCTITEIIDSAGDGGGNTLGSTLGITADGSGNVYVTGSGTDNAFKIETPGTCSTGGTPCTITEILDATGDGAGNTHTSGQYIAVDGAGNVYVSGAGSANVFKVATPGTCSTGGTPCTITEIIDATGDGAGTTLDQAVGVASDGANNVYVSGRASNNAFKIETPSTCSTGGTPCTITKIIDYSGDGAGNNYDHANGVAVDAAGTIYVAGGHSDNAFKIEGVGSPTLTNEISVVPSASLYWPLDVATINLDLTGVDDLLAVSADLGYPVAQATYDDASLAVGAFLDDGTTSSFENDDDAGALSWSVGRTGAAGATGSGNAATTTFSVVDAAAPGTASYTLTDVGAVDPSGTPITLTPINGSFEIGGVWPGDADNNCTVEAADLLPVGVHFGNTGPARSGYDLSWSAKAFTPWGGSSGHADFPQSFADTDGDGEIDEGDVLAFFVNYAETHAETTGCDDGVPKHARVIAHTLSPMPVGTTVTLTLDLTQSLDGVLGTAFKLGFDPAVVKVEGIDAGSFLDNGDLLSMVRVDEKTGAGEAAFTRKGVSAAIQGAGALSVLRLRVLKEAASELRMSDVKLSTVGQGIFRAGTEVELGEAISTANGPTSDLPEAFALHGAYPNPFNPSTTVSFDLPETASVRLVVIDVLGRVVATQTLGQVSAGANRQVQFSADGLASGTYLYRLEALGTSATMGQTGRFVLLK